MMKKNYKEPVIRVVGMEDLLDVVNPGNPTSQFDSKSLEVDEVNEVDNAKAPKSDWDRW